MAFIIFFFFLKKLKKLELSPLNSRYGVLHLLYSESTYFTSPILNPLQTHFEAILSQFWGHLKPILSPFWAHLSPLWARFELILNLWTFCWRPGFFHKRTLKKPGQQQKVTPRTTRKLLAVKKTQKGCWKK